MFFFLGLLRKCELLIENCLLKVDLTAYVEKHEFYFDAVLDENVTNDEVLCVLGVCIHQLGFH